MGMALVNDVTKDAISRQSLNINPKVAANMINSWTNREIRTANIASDLVRCQFAYW